MSRKHLGMGALMGLAALTGCADSTEPTFEGNTVVEGRVEQTTPQPTTAGPSAPQRAPGTWATSVAVVRVQADGSQLELATADVEADGSYSVSGVPAGLDDRAVVAYIDGGAAGEVLIHERSRDGAVILAAPITYETTVEGRAYSRLRASGMASASTGSELALLVRIEGQAAATAATSEAELTAVANAYAAAGTTLTGVYVAEGVTLDPAARAEVVAAAAVDYAVSRNAGASVSAAHDAFSDAAIDLLVDAGANLEATVIATAAGATAFDAALKGSSSIRGSLAIQPMRLNLRARERLSAGFASRAESAVGVAIRQALSQGGASLLGAETVLDLRAAIDVILSASAEAAAAASVDLLTVGASTAVRAEVEARVEEAVAAARLQARLAGATTAQQIAAAASGYRAAVRAAVQAMVEASGSTTVDVDVMTSLYIAACGGAWVG
jgi:hypothetical protein